jgi:MFS family permease
MIVWARHQARAAVPLIDLRLLARRQVLMANLCLVFLCLGCMQNGQVLSLFLQQPVTSGSGFGLSATMSGVALMALLSVAFVVGPAAGSLVTRYSGRIVATGGFLVGALGWALNSMSHEHLAAFLLACTLGSACVVSVQTAAYSLMIDASPEERTSEVVGLAHIVVSVFMGVGAQVIALLLASSTVEFGGGNLPSTDAYSATFAYIAVVSVLGVLIALATPRVRTVRL